MTTKPVRNCFLVALFTLTSLTLNVVYAQSDLSSDGAGSIENQTIATTTAFVVPDIVTKAPWFRVEKLSGDSASLAVGDMVVGPGKAEIEIKPGQTIVFEISVANRISDNRTFEIEVEDMAGLADGSRSVELLGSERGPYSLKDYISFPNNQFELDLGERARIPVTISIPADAEPGGFYGSVLISTVQTKEIDDPNTTARSPIIARVGTLFFVTVPGDVDKSGETKKISLVGNKLWYEKGPVNLSILYENTGSVHLNPYGELRIKNLFGEEVGFVELEPWFALPKSLRSREVTWDRELLFGRYKVTALINRGYDDIVDERSVVFWVLPWKVVGGVFLVLFIIIFSIRFFFRKFEFKRRD